MSPASIERARAAKAVLAALLDDAAEVCGIGLTSVDGGYAVKVNVTSVGAEALHIPAEVDGVPVIVMVAGEILPL